MEDRPSILRELKICRFCLTEKDPLTNIYEKDKNSTIPLPLQIMACCALEVCIFDMILKVFILYLSHALLLLLCFEKLLSVYINVFMCLLWWIIYSCIFLEVFYYGIFHFISKCIMLLFFRCLLMMECHNLFVIPVEYKRKNPTASSKYVNVLMMP